jgi:O-antigen ligase
VLVAVTSLQDPSSARDRHMNQRLQGAGAAWACRLAVMAIVGVAPVIWDPWGVQAFLHPKLLVMGAGLVVGGVVIGRSGPALPTSRVIRLAVVALVVIALAATAAADAPWVALLGSAVRQMGLVAWLGHLLVVLVALNLFRAKPRTGLVTAGSALTLGLIVASGFALLEAIGASPFDFNQTFSGRVQSVMGNPAALGAYLVLGLPVVIAVAREGSLPDWTRRLAGIAALMAVPSLVMAGSRGAWVGAGVAAIAVILTRRSSLRHYQIGVGLLIVVAVLATLPSGRWQTLGEAGEGRAALWQVGIAATLANPVLGVGPDNLGFEFGEHVDEEFVVTYSREQVYDRAHNGVIDAAVAFGVPGAIAYIVLLGATLVVALRGLRSDDPLAVGAGAGVLAYVAQQQAYFQVAVIDAAFWCVVGLLAAHTVPLRPLDWSGKAVRVTAVALGGLLVGYAALGIAADHQDRRALATTNSYVSLDALETAAAIRPFDNVHYIQTAGVAREVPDPALVQDALELVRQGRGYSPTDELMILAEVNVLNQMFRLTGDASWLEEGDALLVALLERDPTNGEAFLRLGTSAYYRSNSAEAEANWLRAEVLLPNSAAPRSNLEVLYAELGR